ncbi:MAG: FAD-dependent oxidoreductase [Caldilineaceae bacterium]
MAPNNDDVRPHIVIVGGGFGGLYAAKTLGNQPVRVTLIDRRNFHLFQPLLYQVAMAGLSPGNISAALRSILSRYENIQVLLGAVIDLNAEQKWVRLADGDQIDYDTLIVATGASHAYFGHADWEARTRQKHWSKRWIFGGACLRPMKLPNASDRGGGPGSPLRWWAPAHRRRAGQHAGGEMKTLYAGR